MSEAKDFVSLVNAGQARVDEIDDYIDRWHDGDSRLGLAEFLGLTPDQYAIWLSHPEMLAGFCGHPDPQPRTPDRPVHASGPVPGSRVWRLAVVHQRKVRYGAANRHRSGKSGLTEPFMRHARRMNHRQACPNAV